MKDKIVFGPYFTPLPASPEPDVRIVGLDLALEWSGPAQAGNIPLFRLRRRCAASGLRLEHILFRRSQACLGVECLDYQVFAGATDSFLPMEAFLVALYRNHDVTRSIFEVLTELTCRLPLHSAVTNPIASDGLLIPSVESQGFRLRTVLRDSTQIFADIGWQPASKAGVLHACLCAFGCTRHGMTAGVWQPSRTLGVAQLLAHELHRLAPGRADAANHQYR